MSSRPSGSSNNAWSQHSQYFASTHVDAMRSQYHTNPPMASPSMSVNGQRSSTTGSQHVSSYHPSGNIHQNAFGLAQPNTAYAAANPLSTRRYISPYAQPGPANSVSAPLPNAASMAVGVQGSQGSAAQGYYNSQAQQSGGLQHRANSNYLPTMSRPSTGLNLAATTFNPGSATSVARNTTTTHAATTSPSQRGYTCMMEHIWHQFPERFFLPGYGTQPTHINEIHNRQTLFVMRFFNDALPVWAQKMVDEARLNELYAYCARCVQGLMMDHVEGIARMSGGYRNIDPATWGQVWAWNAGAIYDGLKTAHNREMAPQHQHQHHQAPTQSLSAQATAISAPLQPPQALPVLPTQAQDTSAAMSVGKPPAAAAPSTPAISSLVRAAPVVPAPGNTKESAINLDSNDAGDEDLVITSVEKISKPTIERMWHRGDPTLEDEGYTRIESEEQVFGDDLSDECYEIRQIWYDVEKNRLARVCPGYQTQFYVKVGDKSGHGWATTFGGINYKYRAWWLEKSEAGIVPKEVAEGKASFPKAKPQKYSWLNAAPRREPSFQTSKTPDKCRVAKSPSPAAAPASKARQTSEERREHKREQNRRYREKRKTQRTGAAAAALNAPVAVPSAPVAHPSTPVAAPQAPTQEVGAENDEDNVDANEDADDLDNIFEAEMQEALRASAENAPEEDGLEEDGLEEDGFEDDGFDAAMQEALEESENADKDEPAPHMAAPSHGANKRKASEEPQTDPTQSPRSPPKRPRLEPVPRKPSSSNNTTPALNFGSSFGSNANPQQSNTPMTSPPKSPHMSPAKTDEDGDSEMGSDDDLFGDEEVEELAAKQAEEAAAKLEEAERAAQLAKEKEEAEEAAKLARKQEADKAAEQEKLVLLARIGGNDAFDLLSSQEIQELVELIKSKVSSQSSAGSAMFRARLARNIGELKEELGKACAGYAELHEYLKEQLTTLE